MVVRRVAIPAAAFADFGTLLRVLRRKARLTQRDLGIAVGYSEAQISRLEQGKRLPDPAVVAALFVPSLRLSGEPELAARLHGLAKAARETAREAARGGDREAVREAAREPAREASREGDRDAAREGGRRYESMAAGGERDDDARGPAATHPDDLAAIPAAPRPSVARPAEAGRLAARLAQARRVLVCGPPGTGKTSLVAAIAHERAREVPVCWLTLTSGITTPVEAVVRRLARFLDRHGQAEVAPLLDPSQVQRPLPRDEQLHLLISALNRIGALICVDNAHLLGDEEQTRSVIEHLASSSQATLVAISREQLQLPGFEPFYLGGLTRGEARALIGLLPGPLLSVPLASRLIDRTDGSPMLIRLALGQVGLTAPDPAALVERLEAQSAVSAYLLHTTLAGLSEPGHLLTGLLAVFRHPVDLFDEGLIEANQAVAASCDVLGGIEELRRRQLVDNAARAALHPLVRDHVYAGLAGNPGHRRTLHRLAATHCERALGDPLEASWHYARAGDQAEAADLLVANVADLAVHGRSARAADLVADLLGPGRVTGDSARQLLVVRGDLLRLTERSGEAEAAYRDALARPAPPGVRAGTAARLAQCLLQRGKVREALELCRGAMAWLSDDDEVLRAQLAVVQSQAHMMLSEFDQAVGAAGTACELAAGFAAVTDAAAGIRCRAYGVLGVVARLRGQPAEAERLLGQSVAAARTAGLREMAGRALFNLAAVAHEYEQLAQAERLYTEALDEMRPIGDAYGVAHVLHALGNIRHHRGATDEAMSLFLESCALRRRLGDPHGAANSEYAYALVLLSLGRTAEARSMVTAVLAATSELGERRSRGHYLDSMALIALVEGDRAAADGYLAEAAVIADDIGEAILGAEVSLHNALAHLASGEVTAARRIAGITDAVAAPAPAGTSTTVGLERLVLAACLALAAGEVTVAAEHAAVAVRRATEAGFLLEAAIAEHIAATVAAVRAGTAPPPPARYPRLILVAEDDQLVPVGDAPDAVTLGTVRPGALRHDSRAPG
jgi:ATP/maltotriose-dependent transcriptional regulator MalT/transcriptional regulator with XRE-family HTH domain